MPDATAGETGAPLAQRVRFALACLFIVGVFVQVYLAGRGAFGAASYSAHKDFGDILHVVPVLMLVATLASAKLRNRTDVTLAILLIVLFEVQFALADLKHPSVGAFHPVNALLLLAVGYSLFRRDLRAVRG
jgi:glycopeptide antibiotics resistance protein